MAARKNRRDGLVVLEDLSKPSQWRKQHGGFDPPSYDADPDTGMVVTHHRAVDTLGMMLSNRTISQEMYDAGTMFRMLFRSARLGALGVSSLARMPGKSTRGMSSHHMRAGIKIAEAIEILGGYDSAAGCCAWHVLGCESSVREWAMRQGWGGRPVPPPQAQGVLVATLGVLAAHFGLLARPRAA
ncbi:MAG: hypothetical protein IT555_03765 [Acetobacteraceae bacterium]|nr:hypothetical protein [Acetobacteraceae bacterium]